jgi:hypothetical protein
MEEDDPWGEGTTTIWQKIIKDPETGKVWHVDVKENKFGLFIKLTERIRRKRDTVIFPPEISPGIRNLMREAERAAREYIRKKGGD